VVTLGMSRLQMARHRIVKPPHFEVLPAEHIYRIRVFLILARRESSDSTAQGCAVLEYDRKSRIDKDCNKDLSSLDGLNFADLER
jgi:hypothetical protein